MLLWFLNWQNMFKIDFEKSHTLAQSIYCDFITAMPLWNSLA